MTHALNDLRMSAEQSPVISLNKVRFSWQKRSGKKSVPVLDIPELAVFAGEKVFIRGPSGSGKTTLLGLLGGVLTPDSGQVTVLGQNLAQCSPTERDQFRAEHIGFIFQMFNLIPYLSVLDNIILPLSFSTQKRQRVRQASDLRGGDLRAGDLRANHPAEKEACRLLTRLRLTEADVLHRPVTELSIGQQQRVAAARALIGAPELIIADEPTSALDTDTRKAFIQLLFSECEAAGSTLIFVSHDSTLESMFDRTLLLHEMNLAAATSTQERE